MTAPAAMYAVPAPISLARPPTSSFARSTSLRINVTPPSTNSRRSSPIPRLPSRCSSLMRALSPERLTDQIAESDGDEQRASWMFFDLSLDTDLEPVDVDVADPLGCGVHASGDARRRVGHLRVV